MTATVPQERQKPHPLIYIYKSKLSRFIHETNHEIGMALLICYAPPAACSKEKQPSVLHLIHAVVHPTEVGRSLPLFEWFIHSWL